MRRATTICPAIRALPMAALVAVATMGVGAWARADVLQQTVASGLDRPINVVPAGDGTGRTFVTEQPGRIRVYHDWKGGSVFLDITSLVVPSGGEEGLLGLAFDPQYATNGFFYVYYTVSGSTDNVVARYHVSADPDVADHDSGTVILMIPHPPLPATNHNGGRLEFGPDGFLYISVGDGGSTPQAGQDLTLLRGKILRIDVDSASPYAVPPSNPFVGGTHGERGEIWAYGLRNPWRFSFDRATGDLFIADVGQSNWEEVDYQIAGSAGGQNYGWDIMEGNHCYPPGTPSCSMAGLTLPILEYDHSHGCSITGGVRARSANLPSWYGKYLYADYCSGHLWAATQGGGGAWSTAVVWEFGGANVSSFGEDEAGEVYVAAQGTGSIYRLREDLPLLTVADAVVKEGNSGSTPAVFMVTLSKTSNVPVTLPYSTMPGSAGPSDFVATSGTLTIPAGATAASISVSVIGDTLDEPNEAFLLMLGTPTGATLARTQAQGTILDDDGRPALYLPIESVPYTITAQGSYRLTHNLSTAQPSGAAITIASDFVVLDLGGFKIGGGAAGLGTTTVGVYGLGRRNVTIRNGNVRGFLRGIFLEGSSSEANVVENVRADENTLAGIHLVGRGSIIRRNLVVATGGTTAMGPDADTFGILADGALARVIDNDVLDTVPVGSGTGYAIQVANAAGSIVEKDRAGNFTPVLSAGVFAASGANVLAVGNRLTGFTSGVWYFGGATGKYARNLTSGVGTPYTGGTDDGGNQ